MLRKTAWLSLMLLLFGVNVFASDVSSQDGTDVASSKNILSPARIVSINLCTDELLLRLVPPERVAALTKHSENPEISTVADAGRGIKRIQGDVEDVLACKADLLIGGKFSNKQTLHFFQYSEIPVVVIGVPKSFEDIYADIRKLAKAVGEPKKGNQLVQSMQTELARIQPKTAGRKKAVFFQSGNLVPGAGTFEDAIMHAAGLENVAAQLGIRDYGSLSLEKLIETKPDVLIFSSDQKKGRTVRGEVLSHPVIKKALPDVKTVTIPSAFLNCGSPASVEAVSILVKETNP